MKVPDDLKPRGRGRRLWRYVTDGYDPNPADVEVLVEACRALDEVDELHAVVARDGVTTSGSRGQTVLHPAMGELRQARAELRRLLEALGLDADEGEAGATSRRASAAARKRWETRGSG